MVRTAPDRTAGADSPARWRDHDVYHCRVYEGADQLYIHPEECIDCGACEPECPVTAIFPEEDVPEQWASYTQKNYAYFEGGVQREVAQGRGS